MTDMQGVMLQQVAPAVTADALAGDRTKEPAAREIRIVYEDKSASAPKELLLKSLLAVYTLPKPLPTQSSVPQPLASELPRGR
jgi:hypothetical protein